MVKDAESHAEEDKKAKALIEAKNEADTLIYSLEKMMKDNADKIEPSEKSGMESVISELRAAVESNDLSKINEAKGKLEQASHSFAQRIYQQASQQAGAGQQGGPSGGDGSSSEKASADSASGGEKVYDADYEVVDDDKKK
jgi:molecular chaperone DnaK